MTRKKEPPNPLFPIKHEFVAALDNFAHQAGMLRDVLEQVIKAGAIKEGPVLDILKERLAAFDAARFGEEEQ